MQDPDDIQNKIVKIIFKQFSMEKQFKGRFYYHRIHKIPFKWNETHTQNHPMYYIWRKQWKFASHVEDMMEITCGIYVNFVVDDIIVEHIMSIQNVDNIKIRVFLI